MFSKFITALSLIVISLSAGFLIMELGVRTFMPQFDVSGQVEFQKLSDGTPIGQFDVTKRQVKNTGDFDVTVHFNELGFRDSKSVTESTKADIFVVGDSFSFGWGVEEKQRFSDVLQTELGRPVFNIAIPTDLNGYKKLVQYAQRNGASIGHLIIGICMENDILNYRDTEDKAGTSVASGGAWVRSLKVWLTSHSSLYFLTTTIIHNTPILRNLFIKLNLIVPNLVGVQRPNDSPIAVESSIERIQGIAGDIQTTVLIIPSRWLWLGDEKVQAIAIQQHDQLVSSLSELGLNILDPRTFMERDQRPLSYHFENDGHWTAEMHEVVGRMLANSIRG